jgi:glutaredoxin 3
MIKQQVEDYPVLLYSRSYCPQSSQVKETLRSLALQFEYFEIDHMSKANAEEDSSEITSALQALTGRKTTPYLFVRGRFCVSLEEIEGVLKLADIPKKSARQSVE